MDAIATSTLMTLAGRCRPCGSRAAITAPLSRSATSQASAETSPGAGALPGAVMMPQPPSALPPTGVGGTTSGSGGSPAAGTSDESTAGGVDTLYGHAAGAALGSPAAVGRPIPVPTANTAAARHDTERKKAIVCAE